MWNSEREDTSTIFVECVLVAMEIQKGETRFWNTQFAEKDELYVYKDLLHWCIITPNVCPTSVGRICFVFRPVGGEEKTRKCHRKPKNDISVHVCIQYKYSSTVAMTG